MELRGSVAIVTGGTGGLGGVICRTFADAGARVVLVYQNSTDLANQRVDELRGAGHEAVAVRADVSSAEGVDTMIKAAVDAYGRVDTLVNNAAFNQWIPFKDLDALTEEVWTKILTINLTGPFLAMKVVAPVMLRGGGGRIVNVASVAGIQAGGSSIAYATSKAGLIHLTRCMAISLAPDILVNSVSPGLMEGTRMTDNLDPAYRQAGRDNALLRRAAHKEDVADQILTFARTDSITGQTVIVDAGRVFH